MSQSHDWLRPAVLLAAVLAHASSSACPVSSHERLQANQPLIVSYYWPVVERDRDLKAHGMSTPNVIDVLASQGHGSKEVRDHWASRGKLLLHRVYPFKSRRSEEQLYEYFAENMRGAAGISIDEVIAHRLTPEQRSVLSRVLKRLRQDFPEKVVAVWDASRWTEGNASLLRALRDNADLLILEVYVRDDEKPASFDVFRKRRENAEKLAPGVRRKILFGIGAHQKMRRRGQGNFAQHLAAQVKYVRALLLPSDLQGLAIYAPVYLDKSEQAVVDGAIRQAFFAGEK